MSARRLLLVAPLLAFALVVPVPAAASSRVDLVGTLLLIHGEDFVTGAATYDYHLQAGRSRVQLKFASAAPDGFVNGATVRVSGRQDGGTIVADGGTATGTQVLESAPGYTGPRKLAVVLVNFTNNTTKPFTRAFANGLVFTNANSVRAYFAEQSHGAMVLQGTTFDWVRVPYANTTCQFGQWGQAANAALAQRGVDLSSYTNVMYLFPPTKACAWGGMGYLPGTLSWINGTPTLRTLAHELAHNFGVHHASTLRCTSNGVRVALSRTCTTNEYGDPFTTMGAASTRHDTNLALAQMGYLPASGTRTITASGSYPLVYSSATSGGRIMRIPRGDGTWFYLEYRRPVGTYFDNYLTTSSAVKGVMIRIAKDWRAITETLLIDTVPSTATFADAPLRLNASFSDYLSRVRIKVTSLTRSTATVAVTFPADTTAPTAPGSVTATATSPSTIALGWTAGTDNRTISGYRIWRNAVLVATTAATTTTFSDTGLTGATTYGYTIRTVDGAGNLSPAATVSTTTPPVDAAPTAPGSVTTAAGTTQVRLSWMAASDDVGVSGYRVWRDGTLVSTTASLSILVTGLTPDTTFVFSVRAVDTAGQVGPAATVSATTLFLDTTPPAAPIATITATNGQWADLHWSAAIDNVGVASYRVYRDGTLFATVTATNVSLRVSVHGSYTVVAVDAAGNASLPSEPVTA